MGNPSLLKAVEEAEKCGTSRLLEVHYRIYYAFNLLVLVEQLEGAPSTHCKNYKKKKGRKETSPDLLAEDY
jgi:hypothetical protein